MVMFIMCHFSFHLPCDVYTYCFIVPPPSHVAIILYNTCIYFSVANIWFGHPEALALPTEVSLAQGLVVPPVAGLNRLDPAPSNCPEPAQVGLGAGLLVATLA